MQITGSSLFVKALQKEQVDVLFAYPGGQAIHLFDALYGARDIQVILPRHEQGLIHAADGYARATGKVGVCLVTSGPGATNLVTGIATAGYDSVPLVCFTGQVPTSLLGDKAFQEVDIVSMTKRICKWSVCVKRREELAAVIQKAFHIAKAGKPGVVVVDLPKDIQQALGSDRYPAYAEIQKANTTASPRQVETALEKLYTAKKPLFLLGGGVNIARANLEMERLTEKIRVPVVTTIMGKGAIPTDHPLYIGNIGIHGSFAANTAISNCDVLFSIGTRFNDRITGKAGTFAKHTAIIHADIAPSAISRNVMVDIAIAADAKDVICALLDRAKPLHTEKWRKQIASWEQCHPLDAQLESAQVIPQNIIRAINRLFDEAIIVADVGQNQLWTTQFLAINKHKRLFTSGGFGTMGYGLPAAIGAKLGCPDKTVIAICGDGGMQMNIQELATAVVYELPVIICIMNNGYLGNVRQWQEIFFGRRYASTCLRWRKSCPPACQAPHGSCPGYTPDFIKLAESYGAAGIRVERAEDIQPALCAAKAWQKGPIVIEFIIPCEENVYPIVAPGKPLGAMIL